MNIYNSTSLDICYIIILIVIITSFINLAQDQLEQQAVSSEPEHEPNWLQQNFTNTIKPELPSDLNTTKVQKPGSVLKLEDQKVAVDIPLQKAYENESEIYFIVTDASDKQTADMFTNITEFKVNFAPVLAKAPESARSQAYIFKNGIHTGEGLLGFQTMVTNTNPEDKGYSPLYQLNFVKWKNDNDSITIKELRGSMQVGQ